MKKLLLALLVTPILAFAQVNYDLLAPIPLGTGGPGGPNTEEIAVADYIPGAIRLIIAIAGAIAVIRIIIAGIQYMSTDALGNKSSAKETIRDSIIGLLLAIGAYTILNTINPQLVNINFTVTPQQAKTEEIEGIRCTDTAPCLTGKAVTCSSAANCSDANVKTCTAADPCRSGTALCPNCTVVGDTDARIPHKTVAEKGCLAPGPCMMHENMMTSLLVLKGQTPGLNWRVTEMFPPSVPHEDDCHALGTCVDLALAEPTIANIAKLMEAAKTVRNNNPGSVKYVYEICPAATLNQFKTSNATNPLLKEFIEADQFKCFAKTTAQHLHIEQLKLN